MRPSTTDLNPADRTPADRTPADRTPVAGAGDAPVASIVVESGPAVDVPVMLGVGRHVIGRSRRAAVRLDDPSVEPHHALLEVHPDGRVDLLQLTGRTPVLVDDRPTPRELRTGSVVSIGGSIVRLAPPSSRPTRPWSDGRHRVVRPPRAVPLLTIPAVETPGDRPEPPGGSGHPGMLVGALTGVVGGLVMAIVTGSALALTLGVVASVASFATWIVTRLRQLRDVRQHRRSTRQRFEEFERAVRDGGRRMRDHHATAHPSLAERLTWTETDELWSRRPEHGDAFTVSVGRGDVERPLPLTATGPVGPDVLAIVEPAGRLTDVEVPARLDQPPVIAVTGPGATGVARALLLQIALSTGPADWCARVVTRSPATWSWVGVLPHASVDGDTAAVVAPDALDEVVMRLDDGDERRVVLVVDDPELLAVRTGPLRRLLDAPRPVTVLLACEDDVGLPAACGAALRLGPGGVARWSADLHDADLSETFGDLRVRTAGVSTELARRVAGRLAGCDDPEDPRSSRGRLPTAVRLTELPTLPRTTDEVLAAWGAGGADPSPSGVVGVSADGLIDLDLVRDGPHALVAGTTGSGKSELLRTLVVSLAARVDPRYLSFVLVDYKGGSTFDACARLPHTVGIVTDLDDGLAERALVSLEAELHRRERVLREHDATDLTAHRRLGAEPLARLVVVIDEFAAMAAELPDFLASLVGIAQRGRSLGIHLVLATQRPAGVVDDAIRANTDLRIALRLHDPADGLDVVGDRSPASFPRGVPGRAVVRLGPEELVVFQSASCTTGEPTDLDAVVDAVDGAARSTGFTGAHRPWLPPLDELPDTVDEPGAGPDDRPADRNEGWPEEWPDDTVGTVDDPAGQRRLPLRWDRAGNLILCGGVGTGTTTTLVSLGAVLARSGARHAIHVIDGRGDPALGALDALPNCSGVIAVDEHERVDRLLRRLVDTIDRRRRTRTDASTDASNDAPGDVMSVRRTEVLLVDGIDVLLRALEQPERVDAGGAHTGPDLVQRVLAEGPAVGVVVAAAGAGAGATTMTRFSERWVFHLDDPSSASLLGVRRTPPRVPGRLVVASSGLEAQVRARSVATMIDPGALDPGALDPGVTDPGGIDDGGAVPEAVERVAVLPDVLRATDLVSGTGRPWFAAGANALAVGRRYDDLDVATLEVGPGARLVVAGPRRSGRTAALATIREAWTAVHPGAPVVELGPAVLSTHAHADGDAADVVAAAVGAVTAVPEALVIVDDADAVDDPSGALARLLAARGPATIVLAGRADVLRSYDHWTAPARRQRTGVVMVATAEADGDVLGAAPPRRCPLRPRPGLAWLVAHGETTLVQLALTEPAVPDGVSRGSA